MSKLTIPGVLVVAVITAASTFALVTTASCGDDEPTCEAKCFPDGMGGGANCAGPDYPCATGPNMDQCPAGCVAEPLA